VSAVADAHVRLDGLVKRFGDTVAVAGVSLDVARGSLTAILGPSGCGKTTLLRLIGGFFAPDAGEIWINGVSQSRVPPYARPTSTVFQEYALFPHLTVFSNVAYGLRLRRLSRVAIAERVSRMLALVRLEGLEERFPTELSGGQQQRVALARALVVEPAVLLMDEPLSNLDAQLRVSVRDELRELQQRLGITTVYVTHDQEEALAVADTVAVMRGGRIVQRGTPREIYEEPVDPWVAGFVGQVNLLHGRIEQGRLRLGSLVVDLPALPAPDGADVLVALRPEAIRITPGRPQGDGLQGEVIGRTYLGTALRYRVRCDAETLTVDDHDPAGKAPLDGHVALVFDPARLRIWPTAGALVQA
jgi:ABC-type Fe3+/spermidine/putrescine transport system ATPase subunit